MPVWEVLNELVRQNLNPDFTPPIAIYVDEELWTRVVLELRIMSQFHSPIENEGIKVISYTSPYGYVDLLPRWHPTKIKWRAKLRRKVI